MRVKLLVVPPEKKRVVICFNVIIKMEVTVSLEIYMYLVQHFAYRHDLLQYVRKVLRKMATLSVPVEAWWKILSPNGISYESKSRTAVADE